MITKDDFTRINNDGTGNPRYVIHFLLCVPGPDYTCNTAQLYTKTCKLMNKVGGRKYHNKSYGGGIVFQSYSLDETIEQIERIKGEMK